ncbi:hypothetical protein, variant [Aphanomyces invadans]|uniref:EGF-like domain-containing protein n=1 Tax=Aphanomyces invadans TaxID=157072 RepID=A0A024ULZ6_9STRA|nr:hypothetical protein, variant [Aphanomyces invadans]ETW06648.1 hypothetical protein, variant [Aphanomyces invadans]|eukprot:XP_008864723.1 hypothetical protein, variant [Aphanomyces invadans]
MATPPVSMVRRTLLAAVAVGLVAGDAHASGFFVCPGQCEAMFLPRDMDDVDDCSCVTTNNQPSRSLLSQSVGGDSSYRCPKGASAKALHPTSFDDCECFENLHRNDKAGQCVTEITCSGKYTLKTGLTSARSLADCDCLDPYIKDESTGECQLTFCPRAANYVKKHGVTQVHSLVDCDCLEPYTKNAQSGECYIRFECPEHASPPVQGYAKSIADCTCDWGFVRPQVKSKKYSGDPFCVAETPTFACPPHSRPLPTVDRSPQNFMDCECANGYDRLEKLEMCVEAMAPSLRGDTNATNATRVEFECPDFSVPLAPHPYSMHQCRCLPGFEPNWSMQSCDWTPDYYVCPPHSFNPYPALPPLGFLDCHCAKGYHRNDADGVCVENDTMLGETGCPAGALAKTWPVHDPAWDCFCPHGEIQTDGNVSAIATADFMSRLDSSVPVDMDWSVRCKNSAVVGFYGCPPNAVMNHWPVVVLEDCSCKAGFDTVAAANDVGMTCNRTTESFPPCTAGMGRSPVDNVCRFPAEAVLPSPHAAAAGATTGRLVVNGNELDYVVVEEGIMVTQGDIAVGTSFGYLGEGPDSDVLFYVLHGYYNKEKESRWKDVRRRGLARGSSSTSCSIVGDHVLYRRQASPAPPRRHLDRDAAYRCQHGLSLCRVQGRVLRRPFDRLRRRRRL